MPSDATLTAGPTYFVAGLDLGQATDPTALAVVERTRADADHPRPQHSLRYLKRWPLKTPYPEIVGETAAPCCPRPTCRNSRPAAWSRTLGSRRGCGGDCLGANGEERDSWPTNANARAARVAARGTGTQGMPTTTSRSSHCSAASTTSS